MVEYCRVGDEECERLRCGEGEEEEEMEGWS